MGRHKASRKKRKSCKRQVRGSDPESIDCRQVKKDPVESEGWDSLDEGALLADYALNATESYATLSEEMEVTKRLSFLNFSMLPCAIDPELIGGVHTEDANCVAEDFLPCLVSADSPCDGEARLGRKRTARRKQTRRVKKVRCIPVFRAKKGRSRAKIGVSGTGGVHSTQPARATESADNSACDVAASGSQVEMVDEAAHTPSNQHHRGQCSESDISESSIDR